jgi:hypothetical protein
LQELKGEYRTQLRNFGTVCGEKLIG